MLVIKLLSNPQIGLMLSPAVRALIGILGLLINLITSRLALTVTYCTKPSKFKGISCAINAIQCYNFQKECYNYQNAVL